MKLLHRRSSRRPDRHGNFNCNSSDMVSLNGVPRHVEHTFGCAGSNITSLEGAPEYVGGDFYCNGTKIESLHNVHQHVKYIGGTFFLSKTIKSHILSVMFIKGLREIYFFGGDNVQRLVEKIINKHLRGDRNIHECQEELLEAGLREFARL